MARRAAKAAPRAARAPRRADGLSREVIVQAATDLLDGGGETALTLRALTVRLNTGYGAVYHHVANKDDLLAAATDDVITRVMAGVVIDADPREALRGVALGLFDAIDAHPWVGAQFSQQPLRPATLEIYECIGRLLDALAVPEHALFDAAGALMHYILGVAGQNAAQARSRTDKPADNPVGNGADKPAGNRASNGADKPAGNGASNAAGNGVDRAAFLDAVAAQWAQLDVEKYPFVRKAAARLREHDDREQFLAGFDIFLAGVATLR